MRNIMLYPGGYYHVYNRGVDKRVVFSDQSDYERFLLCLFACNSLEPRFDYAISRMTRSLQLSNKPLVRVMCFSLMPNHFHLLLEQVEEMGVSKFLHRIGISYTKYFNFRNKRTGRLFATPYQAKEVDVQNYLDYLVAYIHLNPIDLCAQNVIEQRLDFLEKYPWCSYRHYLGIEKMPFIDAGILSELIKFPGQHKEHIKELLEDRNRSKPGFGRNANFTFFYPKPGFDH